MSTPKTREEVEKLKQDWLQDPSWDIENTEGFELYRNELRIFRHLEEEKWRIQNRQRLWKEGERMGLLPKDPMYSVTGGSIDVFKLLSFLYDLQTDVNQLKEQIRNHFGVSQMKRRDTVR
jgi:hypothetical protein